MLNSVCVEAMKKGQTGEFFTIANDEEHNLHEIYQKIFLFYSC